MCFNMSAPKPSPIPPMPNRADDANQAAVASAIKRTKSQNATAATTLTGGLGDPSYGSNVTKATLLGQSAA